ncbi:hypothetical protein VTK56DRAFT_1726 [Thermocarpiscus australiensis]
MVRNGIAYMRATWSPADNATFHFVTRAIPLLEIRCAPYAFHVSMAFLIEDPSAEKPHIGATVVDSTESSERDVLRSEVAAAIRLLKHQFRRGDFRQHHTLPAIVFSFQHDKFGRITQFHFDGRTLMFRHSRLLNFRSDEPTTDAYHMIRWMANQPMGETRRLKTGADAVKGAEVDADKTDGRLPVDVPRA